MFLTTYYDPLYPDLYYYTSVPMNYCSSLSVSQIFWQEGFKVAALEVLDYIVIALSYWRLPCQQASYDIVDTVWPPT